MLRLCGGTSYPSLQVPHGDSMRVVFAYDVKPAFINAPGWGKRLPKELKRLVPPPASDAVSSHGFSTLYPFLLFQSMTFLPIDEKSTHTCSHSLRPRLDPPRTRPFTSLGTIPDCIMGMTVETARTAIEQWLTAGLPPFSFLFIMWARCRLSSLL